ncbi:MAG TPA: hypothetical protein PKX31_00440 [Chitinophagaceae bacterium]|nr:hypothetical protein [Chitinophagaceae bacterium]
MSTFAFEETAQGLNRRVFEDIRKLAKVNGHTEVLSDPEHIFGENGHNAFYMKKDYLQYTKAWRALHSKKELPLSEIFNVFKQCVALDDKSSKLGIDILYGLDASKYIDVQYFTSCILQHNLKSSFSTMYSLFQKLSDLVNQTIPYYTAATSIALINYINLNKIYNKPLFWEFSQMVFNEYDILPAAKGHLKVSISLPENNKEDNLAFRI